MAYPVLHQPLFSPPMFPPVYGACAEAADKKQSTSANAVANGRTKDRSRDFIAASKDTNSYQNSDPGTAVQSAQPNRYDLMRAMSYENLACNLVVSQEGLICSHSK